MTRSVQGSTIEVTEPYIFMITQGGTGEDSIIKAAANLNAIPLSELTDPNGIVKLDVNGKIDRTVVVNSCFRMTNLQGPTELAANATGDYFITDYDVRREYRLYCTNGDIERNGDTVTYYAPRSAGQGGFIINDIFYPVSITGNGVNQPIIISPVSSINIFKSTILFESGPFSTTDNTDTHLNSSWEISTAPDFSTVISQSTNSTVNLLTWNVTGLLENTTYYIRVKHTGVIYGDSNWSQPTVIKTRESFFPKNEIRSIQPSNSRWNAIFGLTTFLSADGQMAIIGASNDSNSAAITCGSVYIYLKNANNEWYEHQHLFPADPTSSKLFGSSASCSLDKNTIAIGAPGNGDYGVNSGAVYIFNKVGELWTQTRKLTIEFETQYDHFGLSIALNPAGDSLLVGSHGWYEEARGAIYFFRKTNNSWSMDSSVVDLQMAPGAAFGFNLSTSANGLTFCTGAHGIARAYIYTRNESSSGWGISPVVLNSPDAESDSNYGYVVKLSGDGSVAVVSAHTGINSRGIRTGAVYIFKKTNNLWLQTAKLLASDGAADNQFGIATAINYDGDIIAIGAKNNTNKNGDQAGAVYIYKKEGDYWIEKIKLLALNGRAYDNFGSFLSMDANGQTLFIKNGRIVDYHSGDAGEIRIFE